MAYDLERFVDAQQGLYDRALAEIQAGHKRTHWMWFIFPQLEGLGSSATARRYALQGLDEAGAYLAHPVLGPRLLASAEAALALPGDSATAVFGSPDDMKLRSSATLFAQVSPADSVFHRLLGKYFNGRPDPRTLHILSE